MARKRGRAYMAWVRSHKKNAPARRRRTYRRRRSARRNPWATGGMTAVPNPGRARRTYRRARAAVSSYKRRRAARRQGKSVNILGIQLPPLETVMYTGLGIIGTPMVEGFASRFLPVELTSNVVGRYALKVGSVLGLTWLTNTLLGSNEAKAVGAGGGAYVLVTALREFAPGVVGMGAYRPMAAYSQMRGGMPGGFLTASAANSAQAQPRFLERGY